jgi:hypothetical protein
MGMWTTDNQDTMSVVLKAFSDASRRNYDSHAFEAGYLQSVIVSILPDLPKRKQNSLINEMIKAAQKQEKEVLDKILDGVNV